MSTINSGILLSQMCLMQLSRNSLSGQTGTAGNSARQSIAGNIQSAISAQRGSAIASERLNSTAGDQYTDTDSYLTHLKEKYGNIRLETVGRDQKSIDKVAGTMIGSDVVIAPKILDKMAKDRELAEKIEGYIDKAFASIPFETMRCAAQGKIFDFEGIIVHEDGTVTEICGCSDSPERIAEVDRINKEKREKEAAERKRIYEHSREMAQIRAKRYEESHSRSVAQARMIAERYEAGTIISAFSM